MTRLRAAAETAVSRFEVKPSVLARPKARDEFLDKVRVMLEKEAAAALRQAEDEGALFADKMRALWESR